MKSHTTYAAYAAAHLAAAAALFLSACQDHAEASVERAATPAIRVATEAAKEQLVPRRLTLTGTLIANRESEVAADATGKVLATHIERGAHVKKGAALIELDASNAALAADVARAELGAARAQADLAQKERERSDQLFRDRAITSAAHDRAVAEHEMRTWSIESALARKTIAEKALKDAVIRAPFSGVVSERLVAAGEFVRPDTRIATLLEIDPLRLELTVGEDHVALIDGSETVEFTVASHPGEKFKGTIRWVGPAVRKSSRDIVVEAIIENKNMRLRPGMFANAIVDAGEEPMLTVPKTAIERRGTSTRVFVVTGGRLEERPVQVGSYHGDCAAIERGLMAGERVVTELGPEIKDGAPVL